MDAAVILTTLDRMSFGQTGHITHVDATLLNERDARRLRELGADEGVMVEKLHKGPFGIDPIACRIGRMIVALRTAQAAAISVKLEARR